MGEEQQVEAPERIWIERPQPQRPIGELYKSHRIAVRMVHEKDVEYVRVQPPTPDAKATARETILRHSSAAFLSFLGKEPFEELVGVVATAITAAQQRGRSGRGRGMRSW